MDAMGAIRAGFYSALLMSDPTLGPCFVFQDISQLPSVLGF